MGNPTMWRDCSLSSAALDRTEGFSRIWCEPHQNVPLPQHPVIGKLPGLTIWLVSIEASRPESVGSMPHHQISSFHCGYAQTPFKLFRWSSVGDPYLNSVTAGPHSGGVRRVHH
jgi:hypothetical protein